MIGWNRNNFYYKYTAVSSDTTLNSNYQIVAVTNGSTITLPAANSRNIGMWFNIIRTGTQNVVIQTTSKQTISGDLTLTLTSQWDSVVVISDGSNWIRCL